MGSRKKYVVVGTGGRAIGSFIKPLINDFKDDIELVGLYDINPERVVAANRLSESEIPAYDDFDKMLDQTGAEAVVVCSTDATHAEYVVKALDRGLEVFSEKPLCTTFEQVQDIRKAAVASDGTGHVTHNMRFGANEPLMKNMIVDGVIGKVLHIQFSEYLDRFHGADYYRRWHRSFKNSGGLMLQKSSHHFDIINWFADAKPDRVTALGRLAFYGKNGPFHGKRCSDCEHTGECDLYADVFSKETMTTLYKTPEHVDLYYRDACVFGPEIDITDTVNACIRYENGIDVSYSLISYASYEGMDISIEGTKGRLDFTSRTNTRWAVGHRDPDSGGSLANDGVSAEDYEYLKHYTPYDGMQDITQHADEGGHGGSDPKLRKMLFGSESIPDPLGQKAVLEEGIQAVLVGIAINRSVELGGNPINVQTMEEC